MTRTIKLICAFAAAGSLYAGCGYPDTRMQPVGSTQIQSQQPAPTSTATDETKKKTSG
ncbi:MAG TPA: hypothetical protein VIA18_29320 [Polyangia bacterium]|jgi:hypothetical protein|nr:hypothetical protein [Polyangia bacterium]